MTNEEYLNTLLVSNRIKFEDIESLYETLINSDYEIKKFVEYLVSYNKDIVKDLKIAYEFVNKIINKSEYELAINKLFEIDKNMQFEKCKVESNKEVSFINNLENNLRYYRKSLDIFKIFYVNDYKTLKLNNEEYALWGEYIGINNEVYFKVVKHHKQVSEIIFNKINTLIIKGNQMIPLKCDEKDIENILKSSNFDSIIVTDIKNWAKKINGDKK